VLLNNLVPGVVDARFYLPGGDGIGSGFTAQLFSGRIGTILDMPLLPTTIFKSSSAADTGYVIPVVVTVPDAPPGALVLVEMRAILDVLGSGCFARSNPTVVTLGGGDQPPAQLIGLRSAVFLGGPECLPEPSTVVLGLCGIGLVLVLRRR